MAKSKKELPEGTYLIDYDQRELALIMVCARNYLQKEEALKELKKEIRTNEEEIDALSNRLIEFFDI